MIEQYGVFLLVCGLVLVLIAWGGLLLRAFQTHWAWGTFVLFVLGIPFFVVRHFAVARRPTLLFVLGLAVVAGTYGLNYYVTHFVDLGPREKIVEGERHITLTGWDGTDYGILQAKSDTIVLQMANPDVTDQTLELLTGMSKLRELDLNDTGITDGGLKTLASLPTLQILRLRKTAITDQGFKDHLADRDNLLELDVRETDVAGKTMREWKEKRKDERKYLHSPRPKGPPS